MPVRIVVLASGSGTNLQALLNAAAAGTLGGEIVGVVTNRPEAGAADRARLAGVRAATVPVEPGEVRVDYDRRLAATVAGFEPDLVVLAGWMRLLSMAFLGEFPRRVVNLHPALPGEYPGTHAIERAFADAQAGRRTHTGVMVHLVPDEGVDDGPVLATATVPICAQDTLASLEDKVHATEHRLLVETVTSWCHAHSEEVRSS
jgi:phosphoribosylglycinamide formyltransferase 1